MIGGAVNVENDVVIGARTKIQTGAYITAYVVIEEDVFVAPMVVTANDNFMGRTERRHQYRKGAHIKRGARVGAGAILLPGVEVAEETFVAAGSLVTRDTPFAQVVMGHPAKPLRPVNQDELLGAEPDNE
jgi:acetyltransferase-like isoleucine patch superfamily enzyme